MRISGKQLDRLSTILAVLFWLVSLVAAGLWIFVEPLPKQFDKLVGLIGVLGIGLTAAVKSWRKRLEDEEFSAPFALAYGYAQFLKRIITAINDSNCVDCLPRMYVYMPRSFAELSPNAIKAIEHRIEAANFRVDHFVASNQAVYNILRQQQNTGIFYDFPRTLNTLQEWIDYKVPSESDSFGSREKGEMERKYISHFREKLEDLVRREALDDYIFFTDRELAFLDDLQGH